MTDDGFIPVDSLDAYQLGPPDDAPRMPGRPVDHPTARPRVHTAPWDPDSALPRPQLPKDDDEPRPMGGHSGDVPASAQAMEPRTASGALPPGAPPPIIAVDSRSGTTRTVLEDAGPDLVRLQIWNANRLATIAHDALEQGDRRFATVNHRALGPIVKGLIDATIPKTLHTLITDNRDVPRMKDITPDMRAQVGPLVELMKKQWTEEKAT